MTIMVGSLQSKTDVVLQIFFTVTVTIKSMVRILGRIGWVLGFGY